MFGIKGIELSPDRIGTALCPVEAPMPAKSIRYGAILGRDG
jgi:hypothetical protein